MEYLFYYMPPTPNKIWEEKDEQNTENFGQSTSFFFCKEIFTYLTTTYLTTTPSKSLYIIFVATFF